MRKTLTVVVAGLVLAGCSAKTAEVVTETTMDPTVTAVSPDAALAGCEANIAAVFDETMTTLKPLVTGADTSDGQVFAQIATTIDTAGARLLIAKSTCQAESPGCAEAGTELVDYYTARLDNIYRLSQSAFGGGPAAVTQPTGPTPELVCR